jgi:hypothetical protein
MENNNVIYKCAVNGAVGTQVYKRKVFTAICGYIKCGDESICGSKEPCKWGHKYLENTPKTKGAYYSSKNRAVALGTTGFVNSRWIFLLIYYIYLLFLSLMNTCQANK